MIVVLKYKLVSVCICLAAMCLLYSSLIYCRVLVVDRQGNPVGNARVMVTHKHGGTVVGVYFGTTDQEGHFFIRSLAVPHPYATLGVRAISADDYMAGASLRQHHRHATITLTPMRDEQKRFYTYETAEGMWSLPSFARQAINWDGKPGESSYIPIASVQTAEQRKLKRER